jgi:hypothetical protein
VCAGACAPAHHLKENIEITKMKKTYFSPESEIVLLNMNLALLAGSEEKEDITDTPVPVVDPKDDEDDGGW